MAATSQHPYQGTTTFVGPLLDAARWAIDAEAAGCGPVGLVALSEHGPGDGLDQLVRRIRLGEAELARRRNRRRQQGASRRANRPG